MKKGYYTLKQAVEKLGISRPTFWRMEKREEITTFKIGKRKKFVTQIEMNRLLKIKTKLDEIQISNPLPTSTTVVE